MSESTAGSHFTWRQLVLVLAVVLVIAAIGSSIFGQVRERMRRTACMGRVGLIVCCALPMYTGDNGGYFPIANGLGSQNFEPLNVMQYIGDGIAYTCPSAPQARSLASFSNYRYRGSGLKDDNAWGHAISIAYDQSGNHPGNAWMTCIFVDGSGEGARPDGTKSLRADLLAVPPSSYARVFPWNVND